MKLKSTYLTFGLFVSISAIACGQIIYPPGNDIFDFDYLRQYRTGVIQNAWNLLLPSGPFTIKDFTQASSLSSGGIRALNVFDDNNINCFAIGGEQYQARKSEHGQNIPYIMGGFTHCPGKHFGLISHFVLDRAKAQDPDYTGKKYRGMAGNLETAVLSFENQNVIAIFGRTRLFWGPQRINLLLSSTAEPLDLLLAGYHRGRINFQFLFARLDGSHPDSIDMVRLPERTFEDNRYMAGHRLDIRLHKRLRFGLFETILYGGEGRPPELYYLNPLQFFHSAQLNENADDNTIIGGDFIFLPGKGMSLYGQLLIDDFQIDDKSQGDQEPDEIGIMGGLFRAGQTGTFNPDIKVEYVRITNRTYHQRDPKNRYLFRNKLLGHPLGPDADSISIKIRFWPSSDFFAEIEAAYRRRGEGSIFKPWDEPWLEAEGDYSEPFPTGVVEKSGLIAIRVRGYIPFSPYTRKHLFVSMDTGIADIENYQNQPGINKTSSFFKIGLSWLGFSKLSISE
ncbi:MAG: capsule assembly Wzi family protein [Candidatus Zixiibacteriota bacterium]